MCVLDRTGLLERLEQWGVETVVCDHPKVATMAESAELALDLPPGERCKSLLLRDKKGRLFLVSTRSDLGSLSLTHLRDVLGSARLSFAKPAQMVDLLGVGPGGLSPLALVNDSAHEVTLVLDSGLREVSSFWFHPLDNAATLAMSASDLQAFLRRLGIEPVWVDLASSDDGSSR